MKTMVTAQRLVEALNERHMIAQDLANATGIGKSSISQYINGSHTPSNTKAGMIGEVLGVNPLWLMGYDVPKYMTISDIIEEDSLIKEYLQNDSIHTLVLLAGKLLPDESVEKYLQSVIQALSAMAEMKEKH